MKSSIGKGEDVGVSLWKADEAWSASGGEAEVYSLGDCSKVPCSELWSPGEDRSGKKWCLDMWNLWDL